MIKVSLNQQLEECALVVQSFYPSMRLMRKSVVDYRRARMLAAIRTIEWLMENEGDIRSYVEERKKNSIIDGISGDAENFGEGWKKTSLNSDGDVVEERVDPRNIYNATAG